MKFIFRLWLLALIPVSVTLLSGITNLVHAQVIVEVVYSLGQTTATPGQTISIAETRLNPTNEPLQWRPDPALRITINTADGQSYNVIATTQEKEHAYLLQPGGFQTLTRQLTLPLLPAGVHTFGIENGASLLALNIMPGKNQPAQASTLHTPYPTAPAHSAPNTNAPAHNTTTGNLQPAPPSAFDALRNAISSYEPMYFDIGGKDGANARFQLSFKYRLFNPTHDAPNSWYNHLYLGYTQTSIWDLAEHSKPFVDTTYNPSAFWYNPSLWQFSDTDWSTGLATGISHRSNGKSGPDPRSLNEGFVQPELNYQFDDGSQISFQPRIKAYFNKDENPDYADYVGHVDWKLRWAQPNGWVITGLYQQGKGGRTTTQLEAAWPLKRTFLNMNGYVHVQYFRGYGQTLLNYRQKSEPQLRIGFALVP